jgi:hypothetical protein
LLVFTWQPKPREFQRYFSGWSTPVAVFTESLKIRFEYHYISSSSWIHINSSYLYGHLTKSCESNYCHREAIAGTAEKANRFFSLKMLCQKGKKILPIRQLRDVLAYRIMPLFGVKTKLEDSL